MMKIEIDYAILHGSGQFQCLRDFILLSKFCGNVGDRAGSGHVKALMGQPSISAAKSQPVAQTTPLLHVTLQVVRVVLGLHTLIEMREQKLVPFHVVLERFLEQPQVPIVLHVSSRHDDRSAGPDRLATAGPYPGVVVQREPVAGARVGAVVPLLVAPIPDYLSVEGAHVVQMQSCRRIGKYVAAVLYLLPVRTITLQPKQIAVHCIFHQLVPPINAHVAASEVAPFLECSPVRQPMHPRGRLGGAAHLGEAESVRGEVRLTCVGEASLLRLRCALAITIRTTFGEDVNVAL
mmetsp:Transcript_7551/g.16322  ORF Transcript_7551/g.16322 Transcript_7551/m.16322 type:complete len:292 (+) Transcript_7551:1641-2516(+)